MNRFYLHFLTFNHKNTTFGTRLKRTIMNIILASTSTLFGGKYLEYLREELVKLYHGIDEVLFIPYARPSGISHEEYTEKAREFFGTIGIKIKGIHEFENPQEAFSFGQNSS